jgi:hypothetical protein
LWQRPHSGTGAAHAGAGSGLRPGRLVPRGARPSPGLQPAQRALHQLRTSLVVRSQLASVAKCLTSCVRRTGTTVRVPAEAKS